MKSLLPAIVAVSLLQIAGSAVSQDTTSPEDAPPTEALTPLRAADIETESPELTHLVGSYTLIGSLANSATVIKNAIDAATAGMNGLKKNLARDRLQAVNKTVTRIEISSVENSVSVSMNDYVVTAPLNGGAADIKTPAGETAKASFQLKTATLIQDIVQNKGRRENAFRFNRDGDLVMLVRETSPALASAVSYSLVFKRGRQ